MVKLTAAASQARVAACKQPAHIISGERRNVSNFAVAGRAQNLSIKPGSEEAFSILTVCTGNICRSPAVERLLTRKLGPTVSVSSAGTHALVGHPIAEPMASLLRNMRRR